MFKKIIPEFYSNRDAHNRHTVPFTDKLIDNDIDGYDKNEKHRFVYDKLFIAKTQHISCNTMNILPSKYPVFVKPQSGKIGGNKFCYKINNKKEFVKYQGKKDLFWCEFIEGKEQSTDFLIDKGKIVFDLTYTIEKTPNTIIGECTIISNTNTCPEKVKQWIYTYLHDYRGPCNIQYINDIIIEVGLRFDSGGNFIQWTKNKSIIDHINYFINTNKWIPFNEYERTFKDVYVIGCFRKYPVVYYIPGYIVTMILQNNNVENYNFYVDEDKAGLKYLNIVSTVKEDCIKSKKIIETLMNFMNNLILFLFGINSIMLIFGRINMWLITITILLYITRFINPTKYIRQMW